MFGLFSSGLINGLIFLGEWSGFVPLYTLLLSQIRKRGGAPPPPPEQPHHHPPLLTLMAPPV